MTYNMTALQNAYYVSDLLVYANTATNGLIGTMMITATFFITLMSLLPYGWKDASIVAGFLSFIVSVVMAFGGFVAVAVPVVLLGLTLLFIFLPDLFEKYVKV